PTGESALLENAQAVIWYKRVREIRLRQNARARQSIRLRGGILPEQGGARRFRREVSRQVLTGQEILEVAAERQRLRRPGTRIVEQDTVLKPLVDETRIVRVGRGR